MIIQNQVVSLNVRQQDNVPENTRNISLLHSESQEANLFRFNIGYLADVDLNQLKCNCGKHFTESENSAICAACGNVSCSKDCHHQHFSETNLCLFKYNFTKDSQLEALNSITWKNILYVQKQNISPGMVINSTSSKFIAAYKHPDNNRVYLQRGFRQYGNPSDENFQHFEIENKITIDYLLHIWRSCICDCWQCGQFSEHPVIQCVKQCQKSEMIFKQDVGFSEFANSICECECEFCGTAKINLTHKNIDCLMFCKNKNVNMFLDEEINSE